MPRQRGRKPIPSPPAEDLRCLYVDKRLSCKQVGANYGVSAPTAQRWLRKAGIQQRPSWATTVSAAYLRELYLTQGLTAAAIAAREQVSTASVRKALRDHQIRRATTGPAPIPPPPVAELRRLYVTQRHSRDVIGFHYGVSESTVRAWLRAAGIRRKPPSWATTVSAAYLRELYLTQGLTIEQIATQERVGPMAVWRALVAFDIPRRPHGRQVAPPVAALELRRLYLEDRWPIRQLAAHYKVSYTTMRQRLAAAGIPLRPPGNRWRRRGRLATRAAGPRAPDGAAQDGPRPGAGGTSTSHKPRRPRDAARVR